MFRGSREPVIPRVTKVFSLFCTFAMVVTYPTQLGDNGGTPGGRIGTEYHNDHIAFPAPSGPITERPVTTTSTVQPFDDYPVYPDYYETNGRASHEYEYAENPTGPTTRPSQPFHAICKIWHAHGDMFWGKECRKVAGGELFFGWTAEGSYHPKLLDNNHPSS